AAALARRGVPGPDLGTARGAGMTSADVAGAGPRRAARERPGPGRLVRGSPARLIYPLLQPVLILVLFVSVMENLASVAGGPYRQFLIPGIMIQNVVLPAPVTGLADRFRSLPMARSAALIGRSASDTVVFFAQAVVMIAVAALLGFHVRT